MKKNPFDSIQEPVPTMNNRPHPIDPTLWRKKSVFSADDMLEFAESVKIKILSSQGSAPIDLDDLAAWVRKAKKTRGSDIELHP